MALITHPPLLFGDHQLDLHRLAGVGFGLVSACFSAGAFLSIKSLGYSEKPITMSMWFHCVSASACLVPLCFSFPDPAVMPSMQQAFVLGGVVITSFVGQLTISRGFQLLSPSTAAAINLTQVLHAHVLSILVLHDHVHWYSFVGAALIISGVLLAQAGKGSRAQKAAAPAEADRFELAGMSRGGEQSALLTGSGEWEGSGTACVAAHQPRSPAEAVQPSKHMKKPELQGV